jgi:hypothetical protein
MPLMSGMVFTYTQIDKNIYVPLPGTQVRRMATGKLWTWEKKAIRIYQDKKQIHVKYVVVMFAFVVIARIDTGSYKLRSSNTSSCRNQH